MIKHQIIVHKPVYTPPAVIQQQLWNAPTKRMTKDEYDVYLKSFPFIIDQYITLGKAPLLRVGGIAQVLRIEHDASKVNYRNDEPMAMKIMQISVDIQGKPWTRWDTSLGWRPLNYEEWARLVNTNNDQLQNYRKQWEEYEG